MKYQNTKQAESVTEKKEALLETHLNTVYRFCLRLCSGRAADAEDLAQDVFVQAWQHQDRFARRSKITTWLMRIALNRHLRLRSGSDRIQNTSEIIETAATPDPARETLERLELTRALEGLPDNLRTAFILVKVEGCKYREAAEMLGVPVGTVQWQVHEAVQRLRTALVEDVAIVPIEKRSPSLTNDTTAKEISHAL